MKSVVVPTLGYGNVKQTAELFLQKHHSSFEIPIPIEEITELKLGIRIISKPRLRELFDIDGFINSGFDEITIDDWVFNHCEERARFTIAHEIGHMLLHKAVYESIKIKSLDEYVNFQNDIPFEAYKKMERQAHWFAGNLLVPISKLKEEIALATIKKTLSNSSPFPQLTTLPKSFNVSLEVVAIQMQKEGLLKNGF